MKKIKLTDDEIRYNHNHDSKGRFSSGGGGGGGGSRFDEDEEEPAGFSDRLEEYVGGGYGLQDILTEEDKDFIRDNMETIKTPMFRVEDSRFTAAKLNDVGQRFSFEGDLRSFTRDKKVTDSMLDENSDDYAFISDPVIFKTVGAAEQFDMSEYTKNYSISDQKESLAGGTWKLVGKEKSGNIPVYLIQQTNPYSTINGRRQMKKKLEQRAYTFNINAEETETGNVITGRPIVYGSRTNIGLFDEVIEVGALDKADLKDVRFLVNHDTSKIPLARSRRNNGNSTMQLIVDERGMSIRVSLDTENNAEARALYSAVQRGDISGMSFMFGVDDEEWENLNSDHPTRHVRSINSVVEVSAVTFPAYESTEINARSKGTLKEARAAINKAKRSQENEKIDELELEKLKTKTLELRFNHYHDSHGKFASGGSGGSGKYFPSKKDKNKDGETKKSSEGNSKPKGKEVSLNKLSTGDAVTFESDDFDGKTKMKATITEVHDDYAIAKTSDGTSLWIDEDTKYQFKYA